MSVQSHVCVVPAAVRLVYRPPVASLTGKSGGLFFFPGIVSQSVDLGWSNNPNTTPTKDYKNV